MFTITLPSGKEVTFRAPTFSDKRESLKGYEPKMGFLPEDIIAGKCLITVGGLKVQEEWEIGSVIDRFEDWDFKDHSFFLEVFMNMFSLDEKAKKMAEEQAKKLMGVAQVTAKSTK